MASPSLRCPFFGRTLVLLIDHSEEGSFGFVVNKPSEFSFDEILSRTGKQDVDASSDQPVMIGGPVAPETGWVLYDPGLTTHPSSGRTMVIDETLACSTSLELLHRIASQPSDERFVMVLGYAGWGAGQLEREMTEGSWIPVDLQARLVFDTPLEQRWAAALASIGIDPARIVDSHVASA